MLDNITLYWLTNRGISSGRLYWENRFPFFDVKNVSIPVAVSVFHGEICQAPRSWAERAYPRLIHYNRVERGGHFGHGPITSPSFTYTHAKRAPPGGFVQVGLCLLETVSEILHPNFPLAKPSVNRGYAQATRWHKLRTCH